MAVNSSRKRMIVTGYRPKLGPGQDAIAFAADIETGEGIYIPPQFVEKEGIDDSDVNEIFDGFVLQTPGNDAYRLAAFLGWVDPDEEEPAAKSAVKSAAKSAAKPNGGEVAPPVQTSEMKMLRQEIATLKESLSESVRREEAVKDELSDLVTFLSGIVDTLDDLKITAGDALLAARRAEGVAKG